MTPQDLKLWRSQAHLTQEQAAQLIGISLSTLQHWERGAARPSRMAERLVRAAMATTTTTATTNG